MIINHNMNAMNAHRNLSMNTVNSGKSMEKLSSGLRINRAGDDAAGLAISEKMRGQIRGLDQASRNSQDGISMIQTAEGALNETQSILQRMRELAAQAANDTNADKDREQIQNEINQLTSEINRIGNTTEFNTQKMLDGGASVAEAGKTEGTGEGAKAVAGKFEVTITIPTNDAEKVTIDGLDFTKKATSPTAASGEFADLAGLKAAIEANATLKDKYDVAVDGAKLVFTQKAGKESAKALEVKDNAGTAVTVDTKTAGVSGATDATGATGAKEATAATKKFGNLTITAKEAGKAGNDVKVEFKIGTVATGNVAVAVKDGVITVTGKTAADLTNDKIKTAIEANDDAKKLVNVEVAAGKGTEQQSAVAATALEGGADAEEAKGKEFSATLQIGANKGQSMTVKIGDMRAEALGISKKGGAGATGAADGADAAKSSYEVVGADLGTLAAGNKVTIAANTSDQIKLTVDGKTAEIKLSAVDYDGTTGKTADDLVKDINAKIAGNTDLAGKVTAELKEGKLVFTSESKDLEVAAGTKDALGALKVTAAKGTEVKPKEEEGAEGAAAAGAFTKSGSVTNGTDDTAVESALDVSTHENATAAIETYSEAINKVSTQRAKLGAYQNRLEHTINNLGTSSENLQAAESRIRDVDMAKEMMTFSKNNILSQAAQAMLAQAKSQPEAVLQLLR